MGFIDVGIAILVGVLGGLIGVTIVVVGIIIWQISVDRHFGNAKNL